MSTKFKDRYVLGEGYPLTSFDEQWVSLLSVYKPSRILGLVWPDEFYTDEDESPKYRLVLERVEEPKP